MGEATDKKDKLKSLERNFEAGHVLFFQGDESKEMYILLAGKVEIIIDRVTVATVGEPGTYLGEMSTLLGLSRTATVKTTAASTFIVVGQNRVEQFLSHSPRQGFKLARILAERLRDTSAALHDAKERTQREYRLIHDLLSHVERQARQDPSAAPLLDQLKEIVRQAAARKAEAAEPHMEVPPSAVLRGGAPPADPTGPEAAAPAAAGPALAQAPGGEADGEDAAGDSRPSLLEKELRCHLHDDGPSFLGYLLKANTQVIDTNPFDVPVYKGPAPGRRHCNYLLMEVHVCPTCHFASNDFNHFRDTKKKTTTRPAEFSQKARKALEDHRPRRAEMVKEAGPSLLVGEGRTPEDAVHAHLLAASCAETIHSQHPETQPLVLVRAANYYLKAAQLCAELDALSREEAFLKKGRELLDKVYPQVQGPNLYKVMFQLMVLQLAFGDETSGSKLFGSFRKMQSGGVPANEQPFLTPYLNRAQQAWEGREFLTLARIIEDRKKEKAPATGAPAGAG
ncbi:MAG: DUF2225 domain-containing protein [Planctomycetes bacterium]|nr:DUF2225 domain-containing protein [Planctomycetota bacterium]